MTEYIKLLIVEDEPSQLTLYSDAIVEFNLASPNLNFNMTAVGSLRDALEKIDTTNFDGSIIDLRLRPDTAPDEAEGNLIIKEIKEKYRFPVFVITGVRSLLDSTTGEPNVFFRVFDRTGADTKQILGMFRQIYESGITKVFGRPGIIEDSLREIFWKHLAESWGNMEDMSQQLILRRTTSCLYEFLQLDGDGNFDKFHSEEVYFIPSIRKQPHTGDVLSKKGEPKDKYIVLSPQCQMATSKANDIALVCIEGLSEGYFQQHVDTCNNSKKSRDHEHNLKELMKIIENSQSLQYHFLPKCKSFEGGLMKPPNRSKLRGIT